MNNEAKLAVIKIAVNNKNETERSKQITLDFIKLLVNLDDKNSTVEPVDYTDEKSIFDHQRKRHSKDKGTLQSVDRKETQ